MLGLLLPVVLAALLGMARSRSVVGLQHIRVRWWSLAVVSLAVQLVLFNPPVDRHPWALEWGHWIWVACLIGMLAVLVGNGLSAPTQRNAWRLAAVGVATNLVVVIANGGFMPQSPAARLEVRGQPLRVDGAPRQLRNVVPGGPDTRLMWLGDVIPQPKWLPAANVVSIGDLLFSAGLAWWAFGVTRSAGWSFRPLPSRRAGRTLSTNAVARYGTPG